MTRVTLGVEATLLVPATDGYDLTLGFAFGGGPAQLTLGPSPGQAPLPLGAMILKIAEMLHIDAFKQVATLSSAPPWDAIFKVQIAPYLTVQVAKVPSVQLVVKLYSGGDYGVKLPPGGLPDWLKIEPNFTVFDLIVGYDKSKGGLDVRARVEFEDQPAGQRLALAAGLRALGDGGDKKEKSQIVSYPFPIPGKRTPNFQVKYLGLGQRFGPTADLSAPDPIKKIFDELEAAFTTNDPATLLATLAKDYYHPDRDWFIGAHLLVRGWEVRAIFNDPVLYGLEVTCSADQFKGLLFEILYQKLAPGLGVYYGALTLPEQFRQIQLGAASLTLPSFKIWIYTNGDFKVSVGWPIGENSIGIEVYIFTGGGGFYFAKLRSGDNPQGGSQQLRLRGSDAVAAADSYNPILAFGLGAWFGVGRSIRKGPFSASLSLTVQGTFQGILAWKAPPSNPNQAQSLSRAPDYYWFAATVGIVGQLQGEVDLKIISISVLVRLSITAGLALETGYGTILNVTAHVEVSASVKILFIRITVSFSATISETFQLSSGPNGVASLDGPQNPAFHGMNDWAAFGDEGLDRLEAAHQSLAAARRLYAEALLGPASVPLPAAPETAAPVALSFLLQPAAVYTGTAGAENGVATLLIDAPAQDGSNPGGNGPTPLESLLTALASWLLRTWSGNTGTWASVVQTLGQGSDEPPTGWETKLDTFLANEVVFTLTGIDLTKSSDPKHAAAFPMFPELQMRWTGHDTDLVFGDTGRTWPNYPEVVREYFAELSLYSVTSNPPVHAAVAFDGDAGGPPTGPALTELLRDDWFLLVSRQMAANLSGTSSTGPDAKLAANLGGMASRYLLNALRLPNPATTPPQPPIDLGKLDVQPGYLLSGQQFAIANGTGPNCAATLSLAPGAGPVKAAIRFAGGGTSCTATMPLQTVPPPPALPLAVNPIPPVFSTDLWIAERNRLPWVGPGGSPFLVPLPTSVLSAAAAAPLTLTASTTAPPKTTAVAVAPALMIPIQVHLVTRQRGENVSGGSAVSPYVPFVYRMDGTDDETRERIDAALAATGALSGATLSVLYNAPATGYRSDALDTAKQPVLAAKTNLSTTTQPTLINTALRLRALAPADQELGPTSAPLSDVPAFLRLVWEVSVVHSGGFFLRYANAKGEGLPVSIFTPPGQTPPADGVPGSDTAPLLLLVTFPAGSTFQPWHNALQVTLSPDFKDTLYLGLSRSGTALQQWQPSYPAGCVGFQATSGTDHLLLRDEGTLWDEDWAAALYHMLQFRVAGSSAYTQSLWSLALTPSKDGSGDSQHAALLSAAENAQQSYRQVVPAYRFVTGAGAAPNPYGAVGTSPSLLLRPNDVFGNALDARTQTTPFNVRYNDPLLPPSEWPGARLAYRFVNEEPTGRQLKLTAQFDPSLVVRTGVALQGVQVHGLRAGAEATDDDRAKQQAQVALARYAVVTAQLADPNTSTTLRTSVLPSNGGVVGDGKALQKQLLAFANAAVAELEKVLTGGTPQKVSVPIPLRIDPTDLKNRADDLFRVQVTLTLARPQQLVDPQAAAGIPRSVTATLDLPANLDPPATSTARALARAAADGGDPPVDVSLPAFARDFQTVFAGFDGAQGMARLAVRADTPNFSAPAGEVFLWAMRLSATHGVQVSFDQAHAAFFTLAPLSTNLMGGTVPVPAYDGELKPTWTNQTRTGIDVDVWAQGFLFAMDEILSASLAPVIAAVDGASYAKLMEAKSHVAQALGKGVVPVFTTDPAAGVVEGDLKTAQDQLEQAALANLSAAYNVSSVVQVPAQVAVAGTAEAGSDTPPRLFGSLTATSASVKEYTLTTTRLPLQATTPGKPAYATFLVSVAQPEREVDVKLGLVFDPPYVEHAIDKADADYGYVPSEWVKFILPDDTGPLHLTLGTVDAPVPARDYPGLPVLKGQRGTQHAQGLRSGGPLDPYLRWDYTADLSLPGAQSQDDVWVEVVYNLPAAGFQAFAAAGGTIEALFQALGSFTEAWPQLRPLLVSLPAGIGGSGPTQPDPKKVVGAVLDRVQAVSSAWGALMGITDRLGNLLFAPEAVAAEGDAPGTVTDRYVVRLAQAFAPQPSLRVFAQAPSVQGTCDAARIIWPVVNGVSNGTPSGPLPTTQAPDDSGCWYMADYPLTAPLKDALTLVVPSIDVLARQTAKASFWIVRNASLSSVPGRVTNLQLVYETPQVVFKNPVVPLISASCVSGFDTISGSLCQTLYQALLPLATAGSAAAAARLLKISVGYAYQMVAPANGGGQYPCGHAPTGGGADDATAGVWSDLQVLLADNLKLATGSGGSDGSLTLAQICTALAADLNAWYGYVKPQTGTAALTVSVVLFADVNGAQLPLIQLSNLVIGVPSGWFGTAACTS